MDLSTFLDKKQSECLNEDDEHPYPHCLSSGGGYLGSDCDEQIILSLSFNQAVKCHSLKIKAPADKGPKTVRIFSNQPNTLDFDKADGMAAVQDLVLTEKQLSGDVIPLKFVKFQNLQHEKECKWRLVLCPGGGLDCTAMIPFCKVEDHAQECRECEWPPLESQEGLGLMLAKRF